MPGIVVVGLVVLGCITLAACPEEVVEIPADRDGRATPRRESPTNELLRTASTASADDVRRLVEAGADVSARDEHGATALHYVAGYAAPAAARELIDAGADPNTNAILPSNAPSGGPGDSLGVAANRAASRAAAAVEEDYKDEDGSPLHWAAHHGNDPEMIKTLIEGGADPNGAGYYHTPLHVTVWRKDPNPKFVDVLIENGADPNRGRGVRPSEPSGGLTPLCYATGHWQAITVVGPVITALTKGGADIDKGRADGYEAALHCAALWTGDIAMIDRLIELGADPSRGRGIDDHDGSTPLCFAVERDNLAVAKRLIEHGADVDKGTADGYESTLHCAARGSENVETIDFLVDLGVDPNRGRGVDDRDGSTPLCFAVERDNLVAAKRLIEHGADVDKGTADGYESTLHCAARGSENVETIDFLVDLGVDPNRGRGIDVHDGRTPLCTAVGRDNLVAAKRLIEHGADVHKGRADGYSSTLHCAALGAENVETIDFLVDLGVDPNRGRGIEVHDGATPLCFAVERAGLPILERLVQHGADPDVGRQSAGSTPFHCMGFASHRDDPDTVLPDIAEYLVRLGVDPAATDDRGDTPLHAAAHAGYGAPLVIISTLIGAGTPVNARNDDGHTALWVARNDRRDSAPDHAGVIAALVAAGGVE